MVIFVAFLVFIVSIPAFCFIWQCLHKVDPTGPFFPLVLFGIFVSSTSFLLSFFVMISPVLKSTIKFLVQT